MRRADRLFQIVQYLRGGRLVTAQKLAKRLEVSTRTIYRDIADLQSTGVPIDGEAGVGYVMEEGYDLPPLMFTRDEITALVAGARLIRAFGGAGAGLVGIRSGRGAGDAGASGRVVQTGAGGQSGFCHYTRAAPGGGGRAVAGWHPLRGQ